MNTALGGMRYSAQELGCQILIVDEGKAEVATVLG
jgi:hypothetical protein